LKKPKKAAPEKPKAGAQSAFSQPSGGASKPGWKKS
jgi:hypothetical protein